MKGTEVVTHAYQLDASNIKQAFHIENSWLTRLAFIGDSRNLILDSKSKYVTPKTKMEVSGTSKKVPTIIKVVDSITKAEANFHLEIIYKLVTSSATGAHEITGTFAEIMAALKLGEISYMDGIQTKTEKINFMTYTLSAKYSLSAVDSTKYSIIDDSHKA